MTDASEERGADNEPADAKGAGRFPINRFLPLIPAISIKIASPRTIVKLEGERVGNGNDTYRRRRNASRNGFHPSISLESTTLVDGEDKNNVPASLKSLLEEITVLLLGGPDAVFNALYDIFFIEGFHNEVASFCCVGLVSKMSQISDIGYQCETIRPSRPSNV